MNRYLSGQKKWFVKPMILIFVGSNPTRFTI